MFLSHEDMKFGEGALFSIVAIALVFLILILIILFVWLMSLIKFKDKEEKPTSTVVQQTKKLTIDDIKDEDMMVAALVATTMFVEETNEKDARLVSIKQIG